MDYTKGMIMEDNDKEARNLKSVWQKTARALKLAKQAEDEARMALVRHVWGTSLNWDGTQTKIFSDGSQIKGKISFQYKIIVEDDTLNAVLDKLPEHINEDVVVWKPEIRVGAYKKLNTVHRKLIDYCIEVRPGKIQIEAS